MDPLDRGNMEVSIQQRLISRVRSLGPIFTITVIAPTLIALLYYMLFASDIYVSESRFVVRSPEKPAASGFGMLLKSAGFTNAGDEIYAAQDFVLSRDALISLNKHGQLSRAYGNHSISIFDRFNPVGLSGSFEDLYHYYQKKVSIEHDTTSSITTLKVRAYSSDDAQRINEQLLRMAEATVNKLNVRGRQDLIQFALTEVQDAQAKAREAALALSIYRNRAGVLDPEKQATVQIQMISKLQDELIASRTELLQLRAIAPENPQIPALETKIESLARSINVELAKVAGDQQSLAGTAAQYQRRVLDSQFADKQLASAMTSLEEARNEARRKQVYVERIVQPNLADEAIEPRRIRGVLATMALGLVAWGILTMLLAGVREHQG